ncbi:MAG: hypothetical protein HC892_09500 [Saprospiraceae bacterium]|nr:hypothetical protein [Saprospiraceae bacterium]
MNLDSLDEILRLCWSSLFRGAVQSRDEFHTPVMATYDGKQPNARTVVLRETIIDTRTLLFFTDVRSAKIDELNHCPFATFVFWNPGKHIQIRAKGQLTLHHKDQLALEKWKQLPPRNRKDYATLQAPGALVETADNHLPDFWSEENLSISQTDTFVENFVVLEAVINQLDWLFLNRIGHKRASFEWNGTHWLKSWLVP